MTKTKCPHENDYTSYGITWETEDIICEEIQCLECEQKGKRIYEFKKETWETN